MKMIRYEIKDERSEDNKHIGFLTAEDKERELHLHCVLYIYNDDTISLEGFLTGDVGKYQFKSMDYNAYSLLFRGRGRGKKPEKAEQAMRNFIKEVQAEVNGKTIEEIKNMEV
jgi:hypothetical protein